MQESMLRRGYLIVPLLLVALAACGPTHMREHDRAVRLQLKKRHIDARTRLEALYRKAPQLPGLANNLGVVYLVTNQLTEAKKLLQQAAAKGHPTALRNLALACIRKKQWRRALSALKKIRPTSAGLQTWRYLSWVAQIRLKLPLSPPLPGCKSVDHRATLLELGHHHLKQGRYQKAVGCTRRYLSQKTGVKSALPYAVLALAHLGQQNVTSAIRILRRGRAVQPRSGMISFLLGTALLLSGDAAKARMHLLTARALDRKIRDLHYNLGVAFYLSGDLRSAESSLNAEITRTPAHHQALYTRAWIQFQQKRYGPALQSTQHCLRARPGYKPAQKLQAVLKRLN